MNIIVPAPAGTSLHLLGVALLAYLLGSIPFGLLITRFGGVGDIRKIGSGNIGATNVLRSGRKGLAAATLFLDAAKGFVAVVLAWNLIPYFNARAEAVAATAVVMGHCFPVWLKFRGGKGVATGLGAVMALSLGTGVICCLIWLLVARLTRISSAGALAAFIVMPVVLPLVGHRSFASSIALSGLVITLLILARHQENIRRIIKGTESRIGRP